MTGRARRVLCRSRRGAEAAAAAQQQQEQQQPVQAKLQVHIDREDRRIKALTEAILFDFLPTALRAAPAACGGAAAAEASPDKDAPLSPSQCKVRARPFVALAGSPCGTTTRARKTEGLTAR